MADFQPLSVDHRFAYPLPESMPSEAAAVLMCAGITVYSPLRAYAGEGTQKMAILGLGGLGSLGDPVRPCTRV